MNVVSKFKLKNIGTKCILFHTEFSSMSHGRDTYCRHAFICLNAPVIVIWFF